MTSAANTMRGAQPQAEELLASLRNMTYADLVALPAVNSIELPNTPRRTQLTTYKDVLASREVRIVVQLAVPGILGTAAIFAKGFRLSRKGVYSELKPDELYEFT